MKMIKVACVFAFLLFGSTVLFTNEFITTVRSYPTGPPAGFSGAPGENDCGACHSSEVGAGTFVILPPANYLPGQTYLLRVRHQTSDSSRRRWGFELTSLDSNDMPAGSFSSLTANTQTLSENGRQYIEHTLDGTFAGQSSGALWSFNWTAPPTNVGTVTFYAAGNQANNDGTNLGDQIYLAATSVDPGAGPTPTPTSTPTATPTPADHIAFVGVPSTGNPGANLASFTVEARKPDNTVDTAYTSTITISKAIGTGGISGTLTRAAVAGVATFNDVQFNGLSNFTLHADSSIFTQITSGVIAIVPPATVIVTNTSDDPGICLPGNCNLREAIEMANANSDQTTINFAIPGSGVHTIFPTGLPATPFNAYPPITAPVIIDGFSQPGSISNTTPVGNNAVLQIQVDGTNAPTFGFPAFQLDPGSQGSTIRGLIITKWPAPSNAIVINSPANSIKGCWIGLDSAGTPSLGNGGNGVEIHANSNLVGGGVGEWNVISGNQANGVKVVSGDSNQVLGNFIGTGVNGTGTIGNAGDGVHIAGGTGNLVAQNTSSNNGNGVTITGETTSGTTVILNYLGTNASATAALGNQQAGLVISGKAHGTGVTRNIISGNLGQSAAPAGILIRDTGTTGNTIQNNFIGVAIDGTTALGNVGTSAGIRIMDLASSNTIGGVGNAEANIIANNSLAGVLVDTGTANSIRGNSIYNNGNLGIDLSPAGVNPNDPGDLDAGPNNLQNYPVITALPTGISGTLNSVAGQTFTVDLYSNTTCDGTNGEGKNYIGSVTTGTTNANGDVSFSVPGTFTVGQVITATATDINGSTSEFSQCAVVTVFSTPTNTPTATPTATPTNTPTATPTNTPTATPTATPTVAVTIGTAPTGLSFTVDSVTYSLPQSFNWTVGSNHSISTTSPQASGSDTRFIWNNWSDGGALIHIVTVNPPISYTANFTTQYLLQTDGGGLGGTVTPPTGFFDAGQVVNVTLTTSPTCHFHHWVGTGNGSYTGGGPAIVVMNGPITEYAAGVCDPPPTTTPTNTPTATPTNTPTSTPTNTPTATPTPTPAGKTLFDYDGDRKADISVFRPSNGLWYLQRSLAGDIVIQLGNSTDKIAPADFDGDGKTDLAVYRPSQGAWYVFNSSTSAVSVSNFGIAEDIPAPGDYDGDGKADIAIYRPSTATWWLNRSTAGLIAIQFGLTGDMPVPGDFDGDGKSDLVVYRPSNGVWYMQQSTAGGFAIQFGNSTDKIVPADFDGDGKMDVAIYRPSQTTWYAYLSSNGAYPVQVFGLATDIPVPADYDGDGRADVAIFRPSNGQWWIDRTGSGVTVIQFGSSGDKPTENAFGN